MVIVVVDGHDDRIHYDIGRYKVVKLTVQNQSDHELPRLVVIINFTTQSRRCFADDASVHDELAWFEDCCHLSSEHALSVS